MDERGLTENARVRRHIRLVAVIGSRARTDRPADSWSDLDLLLFTKNPSVWTALLNTVDVFGSLGKELAGQLGYAYPNDAHAYVVGLLREYRETNNGCRVGE
ncbi:hypothetical protein [Alicyclobacillus mengziensis]|uniref:Uncharacterized protein n=1 Tax=Alicyclobacillus mengziensis TaxID=2931921 RepID=A0A9X7W236_9BACL|nr:hypothetical protein [Alicyclobacillus mengziensis]QSO49224.1 hypothetical protein JZ786_10050 [Alicyclobacillus mengziensis]